MVGMRLQTAMQRARLGQSELARRLGVTPGAINQIATGRTRKSRLLPEIAVELGTTLAYLTGSTDDPGKASADAHDLTSDENRLLNIYRGLPQKDQAALKRLIERMADE